jgi:hypothetical protein
MTHRVRFAADPAGSHTIEAVEQLPPNVRELFWEGLREEPDPDRHGEYMAIRVLESGDEPAYRWLVERMGQEKIRGVIESGRLRPHHERFWRDVLVDARRVRRS